MQVKTFQQHTQDILAKPNTLIPLLKLVNRLLNNSNISASDELILERIRYIRDLFCTKEVHEILGDECDNIDPEKLWLAEDTLRKAKDSQYSANSCLNYFQIIKMIGAISDDVQVIMKMLIEPSPYDLDEWSRIFCIKMIPVICAYNARFSDKKTIM